MSADRMQLQLKLDLLIAEANVHANDAMRLLLEPETIEDLKAIGLYPHIVKAAESWQLVQDEIQLLIEGGDSD